MTSRRAAVSASVFVAVGVLGLSACSSEKPSGLPAFTPSPSSSTSPTSTSKWTREQQQVIAGYDRFNDLMTAIRTKAVKIDMAKAHQVGDEPFITKQLKGMANQLSAGYVDTGKAVSTTYSVTVAGDAATMETCLDATHTKLVNPGNPSAPAVQNPPPNRVTVSLVKDADSWLVSGLKDGGGRCVRG